jgi:hypothetical protein
LSDKPKLSLQGFLDGDDESMAVLDAEERERIDAARAHMQEVNRVLQERAQKVGEDEYRARVRAMWEAATPEAYRQFALSTLEPSEKSALSVERQQKVIDMIKAGPVACTSSRCCVTRSRPRCAGASSAR